MITINSNVEISTPGHRTDGMRGVVTRYEPPYQQHAALYLVSLPPFVNRHGLECSGVFCSLSQLHELRYCGGWVRA